MLFLSIFITSALIAPAAAAGPKCTGAERSVWIGSQPFADHYDGCSRASLGSPAGTINCMSPLYPTLTHGCLECFGAATLCGSQHCAPLCLHNSADPACLTCISTHCMPAMRICVGAASDTDMPNTPSPRGTTTRRPARTRPGVAVLAGGATTATTEAPTTTTTTESFAVSSTTACCTTTGTTAESSITVEPASTTIVTSTSTEIVSTTTVETTTTQAEATTPGPALDPTTTTTKIADMASTLAACFVLIGVSALM